MITENKKDPPPSEPPDPNAIQHRTSKRVSLWEEMSFATKTKRVTGDSPESVAEAIVQHALSKSKLPDGKLRSLTKPPESALAIATAAVFPNPTLASATAVGTSAHSQGEQHFDFREPLTNTDNTLEQEQGESKQRDEPESELTSQNHYCAHPNPDKITKPGL